MRACPGKPSIVVILESPVARAQIPALCAVVRSMLEEDNSRVVVCDVAGIVQPDVAAVDALARLQLTAKRMGSEMCLRSTGTRLQDLIELTGLTGVVALE